MKHVLLFFAAMLLTPAAASAQNGAAGTLSWSLSDNGTTLTIRGEGAMPDYDIGTSPWYDYREKILTAAIEAGVTSIGGWAFAECDALTSLSLPNSLKRIETSAFSNCRKLESVDLPEGVTAIGGWAFRGCTALASVRLPDSLKRIETSAFSNCHKLASVDVPEGVTAIDPDAFDECYALTAVSLPSGLTEIGGNAFAYCRSLTAVTIPRNVKSIGNGVFARCSSLSRISVEEGNTAFSADSGVLFSRDGRMLICYPEGKTDTHYAIPPGVVRIGKRAFERAAFSSVAIPGSVTAIEREAFGHIQSANNRLQHVIVRWTAPPVIHENVFSGTPRDTLHVPPGSKALYEKAEGWKTFETIVEDSEP